MYSCDVSRQFLFNSKGYAWGPIDVCSNALRAFIHTKQQNTTEQLEWWTDTHLYC